MSLFALPSTSVTPQLRLKFARASAHFNKKEYNLHVEDPAREPVGLRWVLGGRWGGGSGVAWGSGEV